MKGGNRDSLIIGAKFYDCYERGVGNSLTDFNEKYVMAGSY